MASLNPLITLAERSVNPNSYYVRCVGKEIGFIIVNESTTGPATFTPFGIQGCEVKDKDGKLHSDRDSAANAILAQYVEYGMQAAVGAGKVLIEMGPNFGAAIVKEVLAGITTVFCYRMKPEGNDWKLAVDYDCPIHGRGRIMTVKSFPNEGDCEKFREEFLAAVERAKLKKVNPLFAPDKKKRTTAPDGDPAGLVAGAVPSDQNPPGATTTP